MCSHAARRVTSICLKYALREMKTGENYWLKWQAHVSNECTKKAGYSNRFYMLDSLFYTARIFLIFLILLLMELAFNMTVQTLTGSILRYSSSNS